jgi:hypothetical protein
MLHFVAALFLLNVNQLQRWIGRFSIQIWRVSFCFFLFFKQNAIFLTRFDINFATQLSMVAPYFAIHPHSAFRRHRFSTIARTVLSRTSIVGL